MIADRYAPYTYALMRIVFGFLFIFHGLQKFGMFGGRVVELASLRGVGAIIELVAGTLIMIGLFTRPAAFIASGQMAVAYFMVHQPSGLWPIQNRGELAALYCFAFLYICTRGAGVWGLDRK
jgi:putative oxidoreductase